MTAAPGGLAGLLLLLLGGSGVFGPGHEVAGPPNDFVEPPPIVMTSTAGRQEAATLGGCFRQGNSTQCSAGMGITPAFGGSLASEVSVVRPGERVTIAVAGAAPTQRLLVVRPLGCSTRVLAAHVLDRDQLDWRVELPPGAYEIGVGVGSFRTEDASGSVEGALGLLVDASRPLEILPADAHTQLCLDESTR